MAPRAEPRVAAESDSIFYFAYGSNCDPERFRKRVGEWRHIRRARLDGYRLRFAASVQSEGGGGAVIDAIDGETVHGVLFEISRTQMEAMDREEFDQSRDREQRGLRTQVTVDAEGESVEAEVYTVRDEGGHCAPSAVYLGHILRGLEAAGHDAAVLESVRRSARCAERAGG